MCFYSLLILVIAVGLLLTENCPRRQSPVCLISAQTIQTLLLPQRCTPSGKSKPCFECNVTNLTICSHVCMLLLWMDLFVNYVS